MAETFALDSLVVPGTYVQVRAEALIGGAAVSTGNIGVVGTAGTVPARTELLSGYAEAVAAFGAYDKFAAGAGTLNLTRAVEIAYRNGAGVVFAHALAAGADSADFTAGFEAVIKDDVNILIAPELSTADAISVLAPIVEEAENNNKDLIAVIGSDADPVADIKAQVTDNDRIIFCAPGIETFDSAEKDLVTLPGTYAAAAVAGLISSLSVQTSPTNKVIPAVTKLSQRFTYGEEVDLLKSRVLVLEERGGVRVVRGLTTDSGPFKEITTRRITDFAKGGIRQVAAPFIGRLNNQRVRKALNGAINGFLTGMVADEALVAYDLSVTATRQDEIAGRALVNVLMQPTFSITFIPVTLTLS
jgi:Phage tail sheath protein subtilisin-like domain/Phage tail sheath C-terminal domain